MITIIIINNFRTRISLIPSFTENNDSNFSVTGKINMSFVVEILSFKGNLGNLYIYTYKYMYINEKLEIKPR